MTPTTRLPFIATALPLGNNGWHAYTGAVLGVYRLLGHEEGDTRDNEEQAFVTTGLFRRADPNTPWTVGFVMITCTTRTLVKSTTRRLTSTSSYRLGYPVRLPKRIWRLGDSLNTEVYNSNNLGNVNVQALSQVNAYWERRARQ